MNCTFPAAAAATSTSTTSTSSSITTTCSCSVSDALRWTMLISEAAFLGDEDMRRLLPAALDHHDLIAAAA